MVEPSSSDRANMSALPQTMRESERLTVIFVLQGDGCRCGARPSCCTRFIHRPTGAQHPDRALPAQQRRNTRGVPQFSIGRALDRANSGFGLQCPLDQPLGQARLWSSRVPARGDLGFAVQ